MTTIAHLISIVMGCVLTPVGVYILWQLLRIALEMIPATRTWFDFRGLDLGTPRPWQVRRLHATATRVRQIGDTPVVSIPKPTTAERPHKQLALPAGPGGEVA